MRLIPSQISPETKSAAERRVFTLLADADLGPSAVGLHSLNLPSHVYKRMGEIDFVVLTPECLLVCEVKGGGLRRRDDGRWEYINRSGKVFRKSEGPFAQARSAMFSLKRELAPRLPGGLVEAINFGYCVITPDVGWTVDSVDEPKELVIDAEDLCADDIAPALERLVRRWVENGKRPALAPADWEQVRDGMRPTFDLVASLHHGATEARERFERLTREQYTGLDWGASQPRLLVSGGAGTGKTMLASEMARRDLDSGLGRVLLTCESPILAAFLGGRVRMPGIDVMTVQAARRIAARKGPWDVVVLDEAQDIFTDEGLDVLDELVLGGPQDGTWRLFYDINNQAGLYGRLDDGLLSVLKESGAPVLTLKRNCRNAKPIILYTRTMTGADLGTPVAGGGPEVRTAFPADRAEEARLLEAEIERLVSDDVVPSSITILSFAERKDSVVGRLPPQTRSEIRTFDMKTAGRERPSRMTFARIDDFKGFENDFILVVDIGRLQGAHADAARLYIALSRARYGLWAAIPEHLREEYEALRAEHLPAVAAASHEDPAV